MIICIILKLPDLKNFISTDILLSQNVTYGCCQGSVWPSVPIWEACDTNLPKVIYLLHLRDLHLPTRDARPAPGKNGCPGPPRPRKISTLPRPAPKKIVLPRPKNIDRMFRGKVRGKCSYITKRFCESKTFEQYFLAPKVLLVAPKVLLEDIQIPPIHF